MGYLLLVWTIVVGTLDNVLRPFLIRQGRPPAACAAVGRRHRRPHRLWPSRYFSRPGRARRRIYTAAVMDGRGYNSARRSGRAAPLSNQDRIIQRDDRRVRRHCAAMNAITMEQCNGICNLETLVSGYDFGSSSLQPLLRVRKLRRVRPINTRFLVYFDEFSAIPL